MAIKFGGDCCGRPSFPSECEETRICCVCSHASNNKHAITPAMQHTSVGSVYLVARSNAIHDSISYIPEHIPHLHIYSGSSTQNLKKPTINGGNKSIQWLNVPHLVKVDAVRFTVVLHLYQQTPIMKTKGLNLSQSLKRKTCRN